MSIKLLPPEEATLERIQKDLKLCEDHLRPWRDQCNQHYRQYRTAGNAIAQFRRSPPDRDTIADEIASGYGSDLHIPVAYSTIETMLPRIVSNRPRGLVLPDEREADENVENMRMLVERQQAFFRYELLNQATVKSGLLYGLGVQKSYWKRQIQAGMPYLTRSADPEASGSAFVQATRDRVLIDDAWGEDCDIFDCFWDPYGYDSFTLDWFAHRTWRKNSYIADQLGMAGDRTQSIWSSDAAQTISAEDIEGMAIGQTQMDSTWRDRMVTAGHTDFQSRGGALHEVIEYWTANGDLITILDRKVPVRIVKNPFWHGQMPFNFYRPTDAAIKQLHGISDVEPLADLIRELDVLRSQRRDNAAIVLQQVFAFDEDAIDRDNLKYGPGIGIPVRSDDPRSHLFPINQGDIPYSGYREEDSLKGDIDRTSGLSDTIMGAEGGGAAQTATGAQLITAAANVRIENKSHRLEVETVAPFTNQQISLNQQMVLEKDVRVPAEPQPGELDPKPWQWLTLTPAELAGQMSFQVEGGSMAPKNQSQDAQLGQNLFNVLRDNPNVDQTQLLRYYIKSQGVKQESTWLKPVPTVPPEVLDALRNRYGQDPNFDQVVQMASQKAAGQ